MKKWYAITTILIGLLFGTAYIQQTYDETGQSPLSHETDPSAMQPPAVSSEPVMQETVVYAHMPEDRYPTPQKEEQDIASESGLLLQSVNGVSLSDDKDEVLRKLGEPDSVGTDELIREREILHYPNMEIGMDNNLVSYVAVDPKAGTINIDGMDLETTYAALKQVLGEPDFVAEDGVVFQSKQQAVKLYIDGSGVVQTIRFFHTSSA